MREIRENKKNNRFRKTFSAIQGSYLPKRRIMKNSRSIYVIMVIVLLLIIIGLISRLMSLENQNPKGAETHTGYPY